jgi:hypothetical protein
MNGVSFKENNDDLESCVSFKKMRQNQSKLINIQINKGFHLFNSLELIALWGDGHTDVVVVVSVL